MVKVKYKFKEYSPIEIKLSSVEDLNNLNILFNYVMNGATVQHMYGFQYFVDMKEEK